MSKFWGILTGAVALTASVMAGGGNFRLPPSLFELPPGERVSYAIPMSPSPRSETTISGSFSVHGSRQHTHMNFETTDSLTALGFFTNMVSRVAALQRQETAQRVREIRAMQVLSAISPYFSHGGAPGPDGILSDLSEDEETSVPVSPATPATGANAIPVNTAANGIVASQNSRQPGKRAEETPPPNDPNYRITRSGKCIRLITWEEGK